MNLRRWPFLERLRVSRASPPERRKVRLVAPGGAGGDSSAGFTWLILVGGKGASPEAATAAPWAFSTSDSLIGVEVNLKPAKRVLCRRS